MQNPNPRLKNFILIAEILKENSLRYEQNINADRVNLIEVG